MKRIEKLTVEYVGYQNPETQEEVDMEILGLESAICGIRHRIVTLRQGVQLNKIMKLSNEEQPNVETVISSQAETPKTEQKSKV